MNFKSYPKEVARENDRLPPGYDWEESTTCARLYHEEEPNDFMLLAWAHKGNMDGEWIVTPEACESLGLGSLQGKVENFDAALTLMTERLINSLA